jgi:NADPH:quinone reductase-like Zn-dependent oxidoreductase
MKAIRYYKYGSPEVLALEDTDMPAVGDGDILVRVHAAALNPLDWHFMRGTPYFMRARFGLSRPKTINGLGADLAGVVEAVGKGVTTVQPGDEVFGCFDISHGIGSLAEYVSMPADSVVHKPANLTFEEAASVPIAGLTALQALQGVQSGQKVLVNGAGGGVGTFAVQIARAMGASVTGVCSTDKVELVRSIGADLDNVGNRPLSYCRKALAPKGTYIANSGTRGRWFGGLERGIKVLLMSRLVRRHKLVLLMARSDRAGLEFLSSLLQDGSIKPIIDRTFPLSASADAIRYLELGHAKGKVVIAG